LQQFKIFNRPYLIGLCTCTIRFKHLSVLSSGIGVRRDICKPQICEVVSAGDGLVLFSRNKEERAALRWQEPRLYRETSGAFAQAAIRSVELIVQPDYVRFTSESGHCRAPVGCSFCAKSGHRACDALWNECDLDFMALRKSEPSELHRQEAYRPQTDCCPTAPSMGRAHDCYL
jgi:hypothetical protein